MSDPEINEATAEESSVVRETCPMCGAKNSATLSQPNGGWTNIKCNECGGGTFYLWIRAETPCTRSLTMLHK
jgi:transcription elongation factor Elf1